MVAARRPIPCRDHPPARQHLDHAQQACTHLRSPGRPRQHGIRMRNEAVPLLEHRCKPVSGQYIACSDAKCLGNSHGCYTHTPPRRHRHPVRRIGAGDRHRYPPWCAGPPCLCRRAFRGRRRRHCCVAPPSPRHRAHLCHPSAPVRHDRPYPALRLDRCVFPALRYPHPCLRPGRERQNRHPLHHHREGQALSHRSSGPSELFHRGWHCWRPERALQHGKHSCLWR